MEDPAKIDAIRSSLNDGSTGSWDDVVGLFTMPQVSLDAAGNALSVNMNQGVTVKLFINADTGEIKPFWLGDIQKNDSGQPNVS